MSTKQMKFDTAAQRGVQERRGPDRPGGRRDHGPDRSQRRGPEVLRRPGRSPRTASPSPRRSSCPQPFENMGAKMVNEVAKKTADVAGDGTTTATVLAQAIFSEGLRHVTAGANAVAIQRGINDAAAVASEAIEEMAREVQGQGRPSQDRDRLRQPRRARSARSSPRRSTRSAPKASSRSRRARRPRRRSSTSRA